MLCGKNPLAVSLHQLKRIYDKNLLSINDHLFRDQIVRKTKKLLIINVYYDNSRNKLCVLVLVQAVTKPGRDAADVKLSDF